MKNKKNKVKSDTSKFGVFNGNVISSETLAYDHEFEVENYQDDSLTITEIKIPASKDKKGEVNNKIKKRKTNYLIYKVTAYIIILLIIVLLIIWLVIR
ncbi:hypothetical protein [Spiroplasma diminutum]|uniref:Transmembrane protein n=1 Tax=Spiroplasma diminutum CUAS-1 TaxID=1276221 RepID=S5MKB0_9MOLU|nr:hypothetical protein [Spiroplasma diminutum]AGR42415.1 hypothetical protein SDIMI_v3c07110 [Spiroplasma diminutum CUAS-1]